MDQISTPPKFTKDGNRIRNEIDLAYISGSRQATFLQIHLVFKTGAFLPRYKEFYECFTYMVRITQPYRDLISDDLMQQGKKWSWMPPTPEAARLGLSIWDDYAKALAQKDLIKVR